MKRMLLAAGAAVLLGACSSEAELPKDVSFKQDVQPILEANCLKCHTEQGKGYTKTGLLMTSHEALMKGTRFGPVIDPGHSVSSVFNQVVEGRVDKSIAMPHGGKNLTEQEQAVLRMWVDQGAKNN